MTAPVLASVEGPTLREIVASELRAQLARRQMSGRELARLLREQQTWVSRRLNASIPSTTDDIERMCSALGISTQRLMANAFAAADEPLEATRAGVTIGASMRGLSPASAPGGRRLTLVTGSDGDYANVGRPAAEPLPLAVASEPVNVVSSIDSWQPASSEHMWHAIGVNDAHAC